MATKNNPGEFDCYQAAADDEPLFVLRANDPLAPTLVRLWVEMRKLGPCAHDPRIVAHHARKETEALNCAADMELWRRQKGTKR